MSFRCHACGRQRAGAIMGRDAVCDECRPKQMGQAAIAIARIHPIDEDLVHDLGRVLDDASNGPPDGAGDGSITASRWTLLNDLVDKVEAFNRALAAVDAELDRPEKAGKLA